MPETQDHPGSTGYHPATVRDLVAVDGLGLAVHDGVDQGLDRPLRWAHSTELPDPGAYLRGGELVCTVGSALREPASCEAFVQALTAAGAAGLCFGVGDVHDEVPPPLVRACRSAGLALLVAPRGVLFSDITEHLASRRVDAAAARTRNRDALVATLLGGLRTQAPVERLLQDAQDLLGGRFELRRDDVLLAGAGPVVDRDAAAAGPDRPGPTAPGSSSMQALADGSVLSWSGQGPDTDDQVLAQLAPVIEVAVGERDLEAALRRERVGQLLLLVQDRLLDPVAMTPFLAPAGLSGDHVVVSAWPGGAAALLSRHLGDGLVGEAPGVALALIGEDGLASRVATDLGLPCGYGSRVPLDQLAQGISQARAALELAYAQGRTVGPSGLVSLEGLLEQQPPSRLEPFVDQLLTPLLESDRRRGTGHVATLRSYLTHDGSLQDTAQDQYLHVNTVRHRLGRIRDLTGHDPTVFGDRVSLAVALWAHDRRRPVAERGPRV